MAKDNMKYLCIQRYYDSGKTTATIKEVSAKDAASVRKYEQCPSFDYYIDVFDTLKEAKQFQKDTLKA